ncbi:MAG: HD-GYP domain-containing protein, partial [Candidatus Rokuibacteriota bacterium]
MVTISDLPRDQVELVFAQLNGLLRLAGLYPPRHPQIQRALQGFLQAIAACLERQSALEYRFLGDLLIAGSRILPRESMMYRRFLEVCQTERKIGGIVFHHGVTEPEIEALVEILATGTGEDVPTWGERKGVTHIVLEEPARREEQTSEVMARRAYFGAVEMLRTIESGILRGEGVSVEQLSSLRVLTSAILEQILSDPSLVLRLANIKSYDEYTLYHSVNVCILSIAVGTLVGVPEGDLRELAVAAVLHDLGKITIPLEILQKSRPLEESEWAVMRRYPVRGSEMLSRLPGFNRLPMIVAFEHQIRDDRMGYPSVPASWTLSPFSQIVGMADAFDSMTTLRKHKRPLPALRALAVLRQAGHQAYGADLVRVLERIVRSAPVGLGAAPPPA